MTEAEWIMGNTLLARYGVDSPMVDIGGLRVLNVSRYQPVGGVFRHAEGADYRPWAHVDAGYRIVNPGEGGRDGDPPMELLATIEPRAFRTVFCTSVLEHTANPWQAMAALATLLFPGGLLYVSVPWIWPTHGDPTLDRWRFSPTGLRLLCGIVGLECLEAGFVEQFTGRATAYLCASKGPLSDRKTAPFAIPSLVEAT